MSLEDKIIKNIRSYLICNWLVGHYSFNLPLVQKLITFILDTHAIKVAVKLQH